MGSLCARPTAPSTLWLYMTSRPFYKCDIVITPFYRSRNVLLEEPQLVSWIWTLDNLWKGWVLNPHLYPLLFLCIGLTAFCHRWQNLTVNMNSEGLGTLFPLLNVEPNTNYVLNTRFLNEYYRTILLSSSHIFYCQCSLFIVSGSIAPLYSYGGLQRRPRAVLPVQTTLQRPRQVFIPALCRGRSWGWQLQCPA